MQERIKDVALCRRYLVNVWGNWGLHVAMALIAAIVLCACATKHPDPPPSTIIQKPNAALMTAPMPQAGPKPLSQTPTGSLWQEANGSLFQDIKAHKIGDILTITVSEESKASKTATTQTTRDKTYAASMNFAGVAAGAPVTTNPIGGASMNPLDGDFKHGFSGSGVTSKTDSMSAYMTATVVNIAPNGNLIIRGSRWTQVNNEMQQIVVEGVVRPADITRNNTVLSQSIAEAKIFFVGKGPVTQHQKPGWALQLFDLVSPF